MKAKQSSGSSRSHQPDTSVFEEVCKLTISMDLKMQRMMANVMVTFQILKMSMMRRTDARSSGNSVARKITEW